MKTQQMEHGLLKLVAETPDESQAICGIIEMNWAWMPESIANFHGCIEAGGNDFNYCLIPDGNLAGDCKTIHPKGEGCDCLQDGITGNFKQWEQLPADYEFQPL